MEFLMVFLLILLGFSAFVLFKSINIVPQGEEWIVERLGKFHSQLLPGMNFIIPIIDNVRYKVSTKEEIINMDSQEVITKDNAVIIISALVYYKITAPQLTVYSIADFRSALSNLAATTLRSMIGEMTLDEALSGRDQIRAKVSNKINDNMSGWGLTLSTIEVQEIRPSKTLQESMEKQVAAEREKKALIMKAEGEKQAAITTAEGLKESMILEAEGKLESAKKEAEAKKELARGDNLAIKSISEQTGDVKMSANYLIFQQYINSIKSLSESNNSKVVFIPTDIKHSAEGLMASTATLFGPLSK